MNIPWKNSPEKTAAAVQRMEERLAEAVADREKIDSQFAAVLEEAEEGSKDALLAREKLRKAKLVTLEKVEETKILLVRARERHVEALQRAKIDSDSRQWLVVEELAKQREELAADLERLAEAVGEKLITLLKLGDTIRHKAPQIGTREATGSLDRPHIEHGFRLQLQKFGCDWAAHWPWGKAKIPSLVDRVREGNACALEFRPTPLKLVKGEKPLGQSASKSELP